MGKTACSPPSMTKPRAWTDAALSSLNCWEDHGCKYQLGSSSFQADKQSFPLALGSLPIKGELDNLVLMQSVIAPHFSIL